jgi:hypothetical protein
MVCLCIFIGSYIFGVVGFKLIYYHFSSFLIIFIECLMHCLIWFWNISVESLVDNSKNIFKL